jgi:hypothetical protein
MFGPVTLRIDPLEANEVVETAKTPRAAWYEILEMEEDPELPPFEFSVASPDDGGEDLDCPEPRTPW